MHKIGNQFLKITKRIFLHNWMKHLMPFSIFEIFYIAKFYLHLSDNPFNLKTAKIKEGLLSLLIIFFNPNYMNKLFSRLSVVALFLLPTLIKAQEGMWLPMLITQNEADMKARGLKIKASDIYDINKGSLKDAVVSFGGFCTGEVVSNQGLVFTNHHCGYGSIQALSTVEKNYLRDGYWAPTLQEEIPAPGLFVTFIVRMEDVTAAAFMGVADNLSEKDRQSAIDKNLADIRKKATKESWQDVMIRPFYDGNQYFMYITETYKDIRFVGAPPSSIGKYGDETDNWVWPRHTGDFSVFRIYAGADNKPADYNASNKPYQPKRFLSISLDGVQENSFNMILGFPGRTQEYLPSFAVKQIQDEINPRRIEIRERALSILDGEMRKDEKVKLQYASKYSVVANYFKKWRGENLGLKKTKAVDKKLAIEKDFDKTVQSNAALKAKYGNLLSDYAKLYKDFEPYAIARNNFSEVFGTNSELLSLMQQMAAIVDRHTKDGDKAIDERKERIKGFLEGFYKDYRADIDQKVLASLMEYYFQKQDAAYISEYAKTQLSQAGGDYTALAKNIFGNTVFTSGDKTLKLLDAPSKDMIESIKKDPAYQFARSLIDNYSNTATPKISAMQPEINRFQRLYMKAQTEVQTKRKFYPDANSTLRVAYGKVAGYKARDAVYYMPQTYVEGIMEKYKPNDYEFDVPEKMRTLIQNKDFGQYADKTGSVPVCFLSTAQTTGGNSGSPCLDGKGNLIGLLFDGSWEGVMSDLNYDESIVRSIVLDVRYLLFVVDKYGGGKRLINELKLVK